MMDSGYFYLTMGAALGGIAGLYLGLAICGRDWTVKKKKKRKPIPKPKKK